MTTNKREKMADTPVMQYHTLFKRIGNAVFQDLDEGVTVTAIAKKYGTDRSNIHYIKRYWLAAMDFGGEEPVALARLKDIVREKAAVQREANKGPREKNLTIYGAAKEHAVSMTERELRRQISTIDGIRVQGVGIVKKAFDRIEVLIDQEKSISSLAKVLSAVLPYVATKIEHDDPDKGESVESRRTKFIQNVVNVYNTGSAAKNPNTLNIIQDDTDEDDDPEGDPEE
jgi:hypothetical protein